MLPTNKNQSHFVRCSLFSSDIAPNYPALYQNVNNLREFIDVKCRRESEIRESLLEHLAKSTDFRSIFEKTLSINSKLTKEQTMTFFLNSSMPLRRFCTENAKLHRITGCHVYSHENILRKMWNEQKMKTADTELIPLEISEAERKYHKDKEEISVSVYRADPEEVLCRTLLDELNQNTPLCIVERLGVKTVIVSAGIDKADHGTLYSLMTCTRYKNNNSAKRRRPCMYMETPAVETTKNLIKLFDPIRNNIALLKDNSCFLLIKDTHNMIWNCALLHCHWNWKVRLDSEWTNTHSDINTYCASMRDCEILKRKTNWNLMNYIITKIYVFLALFDSNGIIKITKDLGDLILCVSGIDDISTIKIMKKMDANTDPSIIEYQEIGEGKLWNQTWSVAEDELQRDDVGMTYIPFCGQKQFIELVLIVMMDSADLKGGPLYISISLCPVPSVLSTSSSGNIGPSFTNCRHWTVIRSFARYSMSLRFMTALSAQEIADITKALITVPISVSIAKSTRNKSLATRPSNTERLKISSEMQHFTME